MAGQLSLKSVSLPSTRPPPDFSADEGGGRELGSRGSGILKKSKFWKFNSGEKHGKLKFPIFPFFWLTVYLEVKQKQSGKLRQNLLREARPLNGSMPWRPLYRRMTPPTIPPPAAYLRFHSQV